MEWSEHFPKNCPPNTAKDASGLVYRFIDKRHHSPKEKDFLSWKELYPDRAYEGGEEECQACGLSIYVSLEEAKRLGSKIPALKRKKIVEGNLDNKDAGKMKNTPSNNSEYHYTWWVSNNITKPHQLFYAIE